VSRYSKVARRIFADEKFRKLSAPQPNGQSLFMWLLITDRLDCIPGLIPIGEAGAAEALRWPLEASPEALAKGFRKGFREAWSEVASLGMAEADWDAQLIWVPNAIRHNKPESPNVVRSWRDAWERMPECDLKRKAYRALKAFVEGMGKAYAEAFSEACPPPDGGGHCQPSPNQEQEQKQEQEQRESGAAPPATRPASPDRAAIETELSKHDCFRVLPQVAAATIDGIRVSMLLPMDLVLQNIRECAEKSEGIGLTSEAMLAKVIAFVKQRPKRCGGQREPIQPSTGRIFKPSEIL
jgi:hypothetical protein